MASTYFLGIDIGGTKIAGAVVSDSSDIVVHDRCPTDAHLGGQSVLDSALNLAAQLLGSANVQISAIGVGAGGQIDSDRGVVISATDILPGWAGIDIAGAFRTRFNLPVSVDNDVNALASGELRFGSAKGCKSAVFLALGTGVGGAIVIEGKIYHGAHWSGGELGHVLIDPDHYLEDYCSGRGLLEAFFDLGGTTNLATTADDVGKLAILNGDPIALSAVQRTGTMLGVGLVTIANILDPEIIIIGGGLAALGDHLLNPAREFLKSNALPGPAKCPIVTAALGEHASTIGAATLAMDVIG